MTLADLIGIALLGGVGAVARFVIDGAISQVRDSPFPFGTLAVNASGALFLGLLVGASVGADAQRLLGTGLLGAYTTFSTWMLESQRLGEDGQLRLGLLNLAVSLAAGLAAAELGRHLGAVL